MFPSPRKTRFKRKYLGSLGRISAEWLYRVRTYTLQVVIGLMSVAEPLRINYTEHERVIELIDIVTYCVEGISIQFTRWNEGHVRGPGLYIAIVSEDSLIECADPMGANRWPVETCGVVSNALDPFFEAASDVAMNCDGAVVISVDGTVLEQMVRFKDLTNEELSRLSDIDRIEYADWMGARHMSAADTSARSNVVATITLSEENGRVTIFNDGSYQDYNRDQLGGEWRPAPDEQRPTD